MPPTSDAPPPMMIGSVALQHDRSRQAARHAVRLEVGLLQVLKTNIPATIRIISAPRRPLARDREIITTSGRKFDRDIQTFLLVNSFLPVGGLHRDLLDPSAHEVEQKRG